MIKKISILTLIVFSLILLTEFTLGVMDFKTFQETFMLNITGDLIAEYDDDLFWRLEGKRPQFERGSNENILKIMCLTDSVSVMLYGGKGYPDILQEALLREIPQKNPVVFNGGVPGYTTFQGLTWLKKELLAYEPDIITVCYGNNDHWCALNGLPDKSQISLKNTIVRKLVRKSKIMGLVHRMAIKSKQKSLCPYDPGKPARVSLIDYENNLREFIGICRKNNIMIIFMTAPYLEAKGAEAWIPMHDEYNFVVSRLAKEQGIGLVDVTEIFRKRKDLFTDPEIDHTHYNWEASNIIAQKLANIIISNLVRSADLTRLE